MVRMGYPEDRTAGLLVVSGGLGPIIPPSIIMVVYATITGDKTEKSFNAAVKAIEGDQAARFKQLSYVFTAAGIPPKVQNDINEKGGLADKFLLKDEGGVKEVACGKNCSISFTFAKGKLKATDYKALVELNMASNFKLEAPAEFHFE